MGTNAVRFAVVLGTNEIASAIGVHLHREGYCVVLSHDPNPPVLRRKMAFHDALFGDVARVENVIGARVESTMDVFKALAGPQHVLVTWLGLLDLLPVRGIDVLIDARMQTRKVTPNLRGMTRFSIGIGPGFSPSVNCDVAIETRPDRLAQVVRDGWTLAKDDVGELGGIGAERLVHSPHEGRWHTPVEIGTRIYKGFVIGHLCGIAVTAPYDGILRGIVRDGSDVTAGVALAEIDRRGRHAQWTGIDTQGQALAQAAIAAIRKHAAGGVRASAASPH
ncbi:xanthine dehydrogenase [Bradyrhizobium sp. 83012]|uniref:Xanthine dehydrogenase n=1 Tax=Bradyrhizobium aeschynomenes TaxID=2734909 RepID=A0ABX2CLP6_9BRAD|nr:xanthine dehydrogenase [Bradyrhizobium aeschynomenes]NPU11673.1 xanthine dehydrogenase [Bradyrhizobium aeschynomenes]NPU69138.1 xanthine dehydrogenase [Bradyrhizobium aeschynomenes]